MTKVTISEDCGNSPKNLFVQELTIALVKGDVKSIFDRVTDGIQWTIVGDKVVQGKGRFANVLEKGRKDTAVQLTIHRIATHGKTGVVEGKITSKSGTTYAFCDIYEFNNAKGTSIKEINSYRIQVE